MCDPITMITGGTALLSAAMGAAQQAIGVTQQLQQAEQPGEADADKARQKAGLLLGKSQARLAAQGADLLGSPINVLGDIAASGQADALSLGYERLRNAWENRIRGASRQAQARYYETAAGNVDPTLGIVKTLLS